MVSRCQKRIPSIPQGRLRPPPGPHRNRQAHIEVPRVEYEKLSDDRLGEPSAALRERVEAARERQRRRFEGSSDMLANADMGPAEVREHCVEDNAGRNLLRAAMQQPHMSARACHGKALRVFLCNSVEVARILKLARTIADLAGSDSIETAHFGGGDSVSDEAGKLDKEVCCSMR